jgi:asparagine synthetase B (glutamine-hydrolysing)
MGADEQLGGYSRHRSRFAESSWSGLIAEMQMDVDRISSRNLGKLFSAAFHPFSVRADIFNESVHYTTHKGRDDRVIADHGKESRLPFLDESVVAFLAEVPAHLKCDPTLGKGCGDKLLLREVAGYLGLVAPRGLEKRAVQFGARSSRLQRKGEKGGAMVD